MAVLVVATNGEKQAVAGEAGTFHRGSAQTDRKMFEARHTMDAPTTTSADNGTSGGGSGWFTPRKQPETSPGGEQEAAEGSRLAAMRPVGRTAAGDASAPPPQNTTQPTATAGPPQPSATTHPPGPIPADVGSDPAAPGPVGRPYAEQGAPAAISTPDMTAPHHIRPTQSTPAHTSYSGQAPQVSAQAPQASAQATAARPEMQAAQPPQASPQATAARPESPGPAPLASPSLNCACRRSAPPRPNRSPRTPY